MLLVAQGEPVGKVAKLFDKSSQVVYYWLTTYLKHHQPDALMDAFRSGRPPVAAAITDKHLLAALKRRVHCILPDAASQCPELNAMDHLFKALKANISANHQYKTIDQHAPYAQDYILKLSHQQARTTAAILSKNFWIRKLL